MLTEAREGHAVDLPNRENLIIQKKKATVMHTCSNCSTDFEVNLYIVFENDDFQDVVCPHCENEFSLYTEE